MPGDPPAEIAALRSQLAEERRARGQAQALFDVVLEAIPDALLLVDGRGDVSSANAAAARLAGTTRAELAGVPVADLLSGPVPPTPWEVFQRQFGAEGPVEARLLSSDGSEVAVDVWCALLRDGDDRVVGALYSVRDRRDTDRLVRQLEQAEARWRLVAELGDLLGRQLDAYESLEETSRWLSRSTGAGVAIVIAPDLVVERVATWPADGGVAEELSGLLARPLVEGSVLYSAVRGGRTVHLPVVQPDVALISAEGAPPGVRSAVVVPLAARNLRLGALLVHSDEHDGVRQRAVVEQAAARVALALANSQLRDAVSRFEATQEAARSREELMAGVSHDMQTPLAVLLGSIRALQGGDDLSPRERDDLYVRMARRGIELRRLVQQFLDYSRLGAGQPIVVRPTLTDVRPLLAQIPLELAGKRPVNLEVPPDLPPAYVDADRLDQVLANLLSNAVKFSPAGSLVEVRAQGAGTNLEISVVDRGRGIPAGELNAVFEKYKRASAAHDVPGSGLGLYVSRAVVEAMGGRLVATSSPGKGSCFTVIVPLRAPGG